MAVFTIAYAYNFQGETMKTSQFATQLFHTLIHILFSTGMPSVSCEDPTPPTNGSIADYESTAEGTEVNYQCDDGLIPGGEMMSTCLANGIWSPDPAELECVEPLQSMIIQTPRLSM